MIGKRTVADSKFSKHLLWDGKLRLRHLSGTRWFTAALGDSNVAAMAPRWNLFLLTSLIWYLWSDPSSVDRNLAILEPKWIEAVCGPVLSSRVSSGALLLTNHKDPWILEKCRESEKNNDGTCNSRCHVTWTPSKSCANWICCICTP